MAKQVVRQSVYAYTFVCPKIAKTTSLILPYANTEMMNIFLKQVAEDFKDNYLIMQVDGAGWHKAKDLKVPENIAFIEQPPYSPELNPVEQIWAEIREKFLDNILFDSIEEVVDKLEVALKEIHNYGDKLKSITFFNHLNVLF